MERPLRAPDDSQTNRYNPYYRSLEDRNRSLVDRIAASPQFQSSPRLRSFLLYVADCALRDAPGEATEQHIGIKVFQRTAGL